jgi:hypothetical protein
MIINKLGDLSIKVGHVARVFSRWSLTEMEPNLSPKQSEEIRSMKAKLYYDILTEIADFLKSERHIVFPREQLLPCERNIQDAMQHG